MIIDNLRPIRYLIKELAGELAETLYYNQCSPNEERETWVVSKGGPWYSTAVAPLVTISTVIP